MKHIVITPVFNEGKYISTYIQSVVNQTRRPDLLVLVDDNSTDNSREIIMEFCSKYNWIRYIFHSSENKKSQGRKVVNAFNYGVQQFDLTEFDCISKLDSDLELPGDYFERVSNAFLEPGIGITGGIICELDADGNWVQKLQARYHIRGALKSYRMTCFNSIGGLKPVLGWDGIDEMNAMYLGWNTKIIDVNVKHFRPASKDYDPVKLNFELGRANWKNGRNLFLALVRALKCARIKPYGRVSIAFLQGYLSGMKSGEDKNVDPQLASFINSFHLKRLFTLDGKISVR
jgi:glycosyltransferase involved in cell wall biosynthesis